MKKYILLIAAVAMFAAGCTEKGNGNGTTDKQLVLEQTSVTLHQNETFSIKSNGRHVYYESHDAFVAMADEEGVVKANYVGETVIDVIADEGKAEFKVTVAPKYNTFVTLPRASYSKRTSAIPSSRTALASATA